MPAGFSMEVTDASVLADEVKQEIVVRDEEAEKLHAQATANAEAIMAIDLDNLQARSDMVGSIEKFGMKNMKASADRNSLMKVRVGQLSEQGAEGGVVSEGLVALNREIKNLDPSAVDFTKKGFFGRLTDPLRKYFEKYERADSVLENILESLEKGKQTIKADNVTLKIEQAELRTTTKALAKEIEMATAMQEIITVKVEEAEAQGQDPEKIKFVKDEILFPLAQRIMDMQQTIVVNQQGVIAMEVVQRNNNELMRGVDRAKNVTVTALRTAVMVASALYNQKIVLQKIQMINETTNNMISATSKMLRTQGTEIQKQATESSLSVDTLKEAFADVLGAMDEISTFRQQALPKMRETITQFRDMADKGEEAIQRIEKGNAASAALDAQKTALGLTEGTAG
jgi:uncharacterized protein YaaN involved in tellurite resistance